MEELKLLIEAIAGLPTITLWVLVGYLVYKLAVVGSIYGVIREIRAMENNPAAHGHSGR